MAAMIVRAAGFALAAAMLAMALKQEKSQLALCLTLAAGAMLLLTAMDGVSAILNMLGDVAQAAGVKSEALALIVRLVGVSYVTEFAAQACRDAEAEGLALKLSLVGKVLMLVMTLPLLKELTTLVLSLTP